MSFALNNPIGDFVRALPALVKRALPEHTRMAVRVMQEELSRVDFRCPEPFREVYLWPLGLDGKRAMPFKNRRQRSFDRVLVVSPFLTERGLTRLNGIGPRHPCFMP